MDGDGKQALRAQVLAARDKLAPEQRRSKSAAICRRLIALPELAGSGAVLCFASFRSEADTAAIIAWCLERRRVVALPLVTGRHEMEAFRVTDPSVDLVEGFRGIPEPRAGLDAVAPQDIATAIVPGAAFDPDGGRIGYGGGFYDTYLPRLAPDVPRIAPAFDLQIVDQVPRDAHDLAVDVVVTETRVLRPRAPDRGR
jgi:5-formyltetrahydrofolate cyclo-ligase